MINTIYIDMYMYNTGGGVRGPGGAGGALRGPRGAAPGPPPLFCSVAGL